MKQGLLAFQYEQERGSTGMTGLSGLMTYVELMDAAGLRSSVERHVGLRECGQGWTDSQIITSLILLNLVGGESVMDMEVLMEAMRQAHRAFIPAPNGAMEGLCKVNADLVGFAQSRSPHQQEALHSYNKYRAYQPLTTYWAEADQIVHSEFRDGNVPAGHQQLRVLTEALEHLPAGVESVMLRSDTAGYQQELLRYCAEGRKSGPRPHGKCRRSRRPRRQRREGSPPPQPWQPCDALKGNSSLPPVEETSPESMPVFSM